MDSKVTSLVIHKTDKGPFSAIQTADTTHFSTIKLHFLSAEVLCVCALLCLLETFLSPCWHFCTAWHHYKWKDYRFNTAGDKMLVPMHMSWSSSLLVRLTQIPFLTMLVLADLRITAHSSTKADLSVTCRISMEELII